MIALVDLPRISPALLQQYQCKQTAQLPDFDINVLLLGRPLFQIQR